VADERVKERKKKELRSGNFLETRAQHPLRRSSRWAAGRRAKRKYPATNDNCSDLWKEPHGWGTKSLRKTATQNKSIEKGHEEMETKPTEKRGEGERNKECMNGQKGKKKTGWVRGRLRRGKGETKKGRIQSGKKSLSTHKQRPTEAKKDQHQKKVGLGANCKKKNAPGQINVMGSGDKKAKTSGGTGGRGPEI